MRILAIADVEDELLLSRLSHGGGGRFDLVVSCGDLTPTYLDCVATMANAPLCYVRGNHDTAYEGDPHLGGIDLDGRVLEVAGLRIAGLEGSVRYREGIVGYTEGEMRRKAVALGLRAALTGGVDVLVTHAPPRGHGDIDDLPHRGFECLNGLLGWVRPTLMLHGHVHLDYGLIGRSRTHPSGAEIVNAYCWQEIELRRDALGVWAFARRED